MHPHCRCICAAYQWTGRSCFLCLSLSGDVECGLGKDGPGMVWASKKPRAENKSAPETRWLIANFCSSVQACYNRDIHLQGERFCCLCPAHLAKPKGLSSSYGRSSARITFYFTSSENIRCSPLTTRLSKPCRGFLLRPTCFRLFITSDDKMLTHTKAEVHTKTSYLF